MVKYDLAVIGAGPGGYVAAIRAAQLGKRVVIVERDKAGGVCLNVGCIPSKALIHQAEIYTNGAELEELGVTLNWKGFDYAKAHRKSREAADTLSRGVQFLLKKNKIDYVKGFGRIEDRTHVAVEGEGGRIIESENILIATGSRPREMAGFEFDERTVLSSTGMLGLTRLPKTLLVLGAGVIGMEFAHIMHSFGVRVIMVELLPQILAGADEELAALMRAHYTKEGIEICTGYRALALRKGTGGGAGDGDGGGVELVAAGPEGGERVFAAEKLLVSVGRVPNTEGLNLEAMGIKQERGFIRVGRHYRTTVSNIYAIGDVIPTPQLAHVASKEGEIVAEYISGRTPMHHTFPDDLYPFAVYTEPELAWFGATEAELKARGVAHSVSRFPYRGAGKSVAVGASGGMVKVCFNKNTNEILGAHICGKNATELIHELLLAKQAELLPEDIADVVHAHPTLSEVTLEVSRAAQGWAIHA